METTTADAAAAAAVTPTSTDTAVVGTTASVFQPSTFTVLMDQSTQVVPGLNTSPAWLDDVSSDDVIFPNTSVFPELYTGGGNGSANSSLMLAPTFNEVRVQFAWLAANH